jgi:Fur family ferric uptake transcriptional regulator
MSDQSDSHQEHGIGERTAGARGLVTGPDRERLASGQRAAGPIGGQQPAQPWTELALDQLAAAGYKRGGARREVVELLGSQRCALSPLELEQVLAGGERRVSRASVYRVLEELEALSLVQRVEVGAGITRYEPAGSGHAHHDHLVCDRCGRVEPFFDAGLEQAIANLAAGVPLHVSDHEVILHGACSECER